MTDLECFNCSGAGDCIFYPNVQSVVNADAGMWLDGGALDWFTEPCPYCRYDEYYEHREGPGNAPWIFWLG